MTRLRLSDWQDNTAECSTLGNCLLQLKSHAAHPREQAATKPIAGMIEWQAQWSQNQEQISRRLELIEDELNKLVAAELPPLSLVTADY